MVSMFVLIRSLTEFDSQMQRDKTPSERVCQFTFSGPTVDALGTTSCRVGNETVRVGWVISSVPEYVIKLEDVHHAHVDATSYCEKETRYGTTWERKYSGVRTVR